MKLIITEKPSVARDIARILKINKRGEGYMESGEYLISWCLGHLVGLADPHMYNKSYEKWEIEHLPIIPDKFKLAVLERTKDQFAVVERLINDERVDSLICATDSGREGELIFRFVYQYAKSKKPFKRLWINSMTDAAITEGFSKLKDGSEYDKLYYAARCRSESDWLVGLNLTRLVTVKNRDRLSIGRVQTPTLAMIVNRDEQVENFVSNAFFQLRSHYEKKFTGNWFKEDVSRFDKKEDAQKIIDDIKGKQAKVVSIETKQKSVERPLLYDLTELQRDANKRFGYTAQEVLDSAQALYETHKLATYPRTDSRYITTDMEKNLPSLIDKVEKSPFGYKLSQSPLIDKRVVNNEKVTDHHAIIPTENIARADLSKLPEKDYNVLQLITARFIVTLSQPHLYDHTTAIMDIGGQTFKTTGKKIVSGGWKDAEIGFMGSNDADDEAVEEDDQNLPVLSVGDLINVEKIELITSKTTAPKRYTEATLLSAMENAGRIVEDDELRAAMSERGLGTPSTRAAIIEKLLGYGYIIREKKNIVSTAKGRRLINLAPEGMKSPEMTGNWEFKLNKIAKGTEKAENFMREITDYVKELVAQGKNEKTVLPEKRGFNFTGKTITGKCPFCGKNVYEMTQSYTCEGKNIDCNFTLWKDNKFLANMGKTLTPTAASQFLKQGHSSYKGLIDRNGVKYDATIHLENIDGQVRFRTERKVK